MKKLTKNLLLGAAVLGAAAYVTHQLFNDDSKLRMRRKERDAFDYLVEKHGEEAMKGKKVVIVDENDHATKLDVAKDVVDYKVHKEE